MNRHIEIGVFALVVTSMSIALICQPKTEPAPPPRSEVIGEWFSALDGSHLVLTKRVKEKLSVPDSYEHLKTTYFDRDTDTLVVRTMFTAQGTGGRRIGMTAVGLCDVNTGEVIKLVNIFETR